MKIKSESWLNLNWNITINILQRNLYVMIFKETFPFYLLNMEVRATVYWFPAMDTLT